MTRKAPKKGVKRAARKKITVKQVAKAMEEVGTSLNERQKLFCVLFLTDKWCFANATQSYAEAYNIRRDNKAGMRTARANGYKLLTNAHINRYLNKMLDAQLEEAAVDREMAKIVLQNRDLHAKNGAIAEYNKVRGRILDKKQLLDADGKPIQILGLAIHVPETVSKK